MKLKSWSTLWLKIKLFLVDILCGYYLVFVVFFFLPLLSFSISKIPFPRKPYINVFSTTVVLRLSYGEVIWFFSLEMNLKKSAQMDWDILVTWSRRGGRRCWGDFYPKVSILGKFRRGQLHRAFLNFPCRISIQYLFSISYCL